MIAKFAAFAVLLPALVFGVAAADRLAIAEPVNKGGLPPADVEAVWGMLEGSVDGGFELVSRSAVKQMMTEIGLTESSGLVNLDSAQKAKLGELKTVRYLLVPTVAKFGSRINFTLVMVDASTGVVDPDRRTSETVNNLDDLADRLPDMLSEINLGRQARKSGKVALLAPIVTAPDAPAYVGDYFNSYLESTLLANNIKVIALQSIGKILKKNNIDAVFEAEPAMFARIGKLLRADLLVQAQLSRFSFSVKNEYIVASKRNVVRCIGSFDGSMRVISAQTGDVVASFPFRENINLGNLDPNVTGDWANEDFGKHLIEQMIPVVAKQLVPKLR